MISVWMPPLPYVTAVYKLKVGSYLALLMLCNMTLLIVHSASALKVSMHNAFNCLYLADALKVSSHRDQLIDAYFFLSVITYQ